MKLGLINSAWAQAGKDLAFGIRKTKEIGFDSIDIFADPLDLDEEGRAAIAEECDRVALPIGASFSSARSPWKAWRWA